MMVLNQIQPFGRHGLNKTALYGLKMDVCVLQTDHKPSIDRGFILNLYIISTIVNPNLFAAERKKQPTLAHDHVLSKTL